MVRVRKLAWLYFFTVVVIATQAQVFRTEQRKMLKFTADTLFLDSLSLVHGSVQFTCFPACDTTHQPKVNYQKHALVCASPKPDSIAVFYKRFPLNFEKRYFHKSSDMLYNDFTRRGNPYNIKFGTQSPQDNLFLNDGLSKNGNISRGISFGNTQDVVVNSNLNLQVSGKLTPEIDMVMAATDNNIPFQADGTTAQLQEFDKVFIQLNNASTKMVVGDYQLSRPQNSYFMNFYKRAQGIYLDNTYSDSACKNPWRIKTQASVAVSRGKFSRQVFFGIESNQGPYRLKGANNETFIIVLSGTEKIYIDGKLLLRGQENDYIIDYNTGEVSFTAKQIITKDKRIVAEFQYAERNYARSLFFLGEEISNKTTKVYLNYFQEQDNKNKPLQQSLSQNQKDAMFAVGDTIAKAYGSGVEANVVYNNSDVFYRRKDTVVNGTAHTFYAYTTIPDEANYRIRFSQVGQGNGNYIQIASSANGKVYRWLPPVNGIPQGIYDTVIPLVTPKLNQMLTVGLTESLTANNLLTIEGVYTKNDLNRFSTLNKGNDEGSGFKVISKNTAPLRNDSSKVQTSLHYNFNYEFVQQRFTQIERFRSIEFDRDWNRPLTGILRNDQHLANAEVGITKTNKYGITYAANIFDEGNNYLGVRHVLQTNLNDEFLKVAYNGSYLSANDKLNSVNSRFYRHLSSASTKIDKVRLAYTDVFENNLFMKTKSDSLAAKAYQFWEWEASASNADSSKNSLKVFYRERRDKLNYGNELKDSTRAQNIGIKAGFYKIKNNPVSLVITHRKLDLTKNIIGGFLKPDNTLLGRLEYNPRYFKGLITAALFYETGYGLENKKEYYYLEVAPGQGQFTWRDYNSNGIKELNEFEVALFSDQARFIRIYTPTSQYIKVLQNQCSFTANLRPTAKMRQSRKRGMRFINRWALQTAIKLDNKITDTKGKYNYNPFYDVTDSLIIANNNNKRHSVFFNQSSAYFSADYTYINNQSKQLLTNGLEARWLESHEIKTRLNVLKLWALNVNALLSQKQNTSKFFTARNYNIKTVESEQKIIYQPNTVFRLSGIYKYSEKKNQTQTRLQTAYINTFGVELKYNKSEKGSLTAKFDMINIQFNADQNSAAAYDMLNGFNNGQNFAWEINYQRNLNNNLQMSINYNARKTPGANVIHLGGAQVRAFF